MQLKQELTNAISRGDLDTVQRIVAIRNDQGVPIVGLNTGFRLGSALACAFAAHPMNEQIIRVFLNVRDIHNNVVADINGSAPCGLSLFYWILSSPHLTSAAKVNLLQYILDTRDGNGRLVVDLSQQHVNTSLFEIALEHNQIDCFRILLDARDANGDYALNINRIKWGRTLLDRVLERYNHNGEVVRLAREAGGLTAEEVRRILTENGLTEDQVQVDEAIRVYREGIIRIQPVVRNPEVTEVQQQAEIQAFINNSQNTHDPKVTTSVNASILRLMKRYQEVDGQGTLLDVRKLLGQSDFVPEKKTVISNCLDRIARDSTKRTGCNATLSEVLALVWSGIHDKTALTEDVFELTDNDIKHREYSLLCALYRAETEYLTHAACFVGTFNQLLQTLQKVHPDVEIISANVISAANERAHTIVKEELEKEPSELKKAILLSWENSEEEDQFNAAQKFRTKVVEIAKETLKIEYELLLTANERVQITNHFANLDKPILDKKLKILLESIDAIPDAIGDNEEQHELFFFNHESDIVLNDITENTVILLGKDKEKTVRFVKITEIQGENANQKTLLPQTAKLILSDEEQLLYAEIQGKFKVTDKLPSLVVKLTKQGSQTVEEQTEIDTKNREIAKENQLITEERAKLSQKYKKICSDTIELALLNGGFRHYKPKAIAVLKQKARQIRTDYDGENGEILRQRLQAEYDGFEKISKLEEEINRLAAGQNVSLLQEVYNQLKLFLQLCYDEGIKNSFSLSWQKLDAAYGDFNSFFDLVKEIHQISIQIGIHPQKKAAVENLLVLLVDELKKENPQIAAITHQIRLEFEALQRFDRYVQAALSIRESYSGSAQKRLDVIKAIENFVTEQYQQYANRRLSADECIINIINRTKSVRHTVQHDHKTHSWTRFLGDWQPESRLVSAIDQTFRLKQSSLFKLEEALQKIIDRNPSNPFLNAYEPKRNSILELLNAVQQAEYNKAGETFQQIVESWRNKETVYSTEIEKNGQKQQKLYTNGELIALSRNSFFKLSNKTETQVALDNLVNQFGNEALSDDNYLNLLH